MNPPQVLSSRWSRGAAYLLTLAALVAALLIVPGDSCGATMSGACVLSDRPPFTLYGGVGDLMQLHHGSVTVTGAAAGRTLRNQSAWDAPASREGVVVVVYVTGSALAQQASMTAALVAGDRRYAPRLSPGRPTFKAGIVSTGVTVFDVPADVPEQGFELELSLVGAGDQAAVVAVPPLTVAQDVAGPKP
ncbi:MAG: hypothetical protein V9G08_08000 [Dermatophilaceae bacterium]